MKRVDIHIRLSENLYKKLGQLRKTVERELDVQVSMNDLINMLLVNGSKEAEQNKLQPHLKLHRIR